MKIKIAMIAFLLTAVLAANAQPGGGRGGDPIQRAEMQSKMMVDSLSLSTKQGDKVKEINLKYANKQVEVRNASTDGDWDKMRASMDALRNEQNAELKTVLTQEQYDRWQKIAAAQWQGRGRGGPPPPSGTDEKGKDKKSKKEKKGTPPPPSPPPPAPEKEGGSGQ